MLFDWPAQAAFGRVVPKNAIYQHAYVKTAMKELFVRQVEQIVWEYKLAPETINIPASSTVPEFQVFTVTVRGETLKDDLLLCIDRAIPYPLLFELRRPGQINYTAAYKGPNGAGSNAWVVGRYFTSGWLPDDSPRKPLPLVLNMESLYAAILAPLLPYPARAEENLAEHMARLEAIGKLQAEIERCGKKLRQEKQFNRKITLNQAFRLRQKQLAPLIATNGADIATEI